MRAESFELPFTVRAGATKYRPHGRLDVSLIHAFLAQSYWSPGIPRDIVERAIAGSLNFGVYRKGAQIGFARVVTDGATFAYLADVFVLADTAARDLPRGS